MEVGSITCPRMSWIRYLRFSQPWRQPNSARRFMASTVSREPQQLASASTKPAWNSMSWLRTSSRTFQLRQYLAWISRSHLRRTASACSRAQETRNSASWKAKSPAPSLWSSSMRPCTRSQSWLVWGARLRSPSSWTSCSWDSAFMSCSSTFFQAWKTADVWALRTFPRASSRMVQKSPKLIVVLSSYCHKTWCSASLLGRIRALMPKSARASTSLGMSKSLPVFCGKYRPNDSCARSTSHRLATRSRW
mmetsp:Transcript_113106/g.365372  ORF Transcript_113106/g.365372 Transcript_113106/m.365372 type:complete len:249 (+) Transcript_113106:925-1671(+)